MTKLAQLKFTVLLLLVFTAGFARSGALNDEAFKAVAEEAYIYTYPMVENYLSLYQYALDPDNDQFKAPLNTIGNVARVFTPKDTGVVTPNSDTPYSFLVMDLRNGPLVLSLPEVSQDRYYSVQLIDLYTHNVDYLGTRTDGNNGGVFLITGPGWKGDTPEGVRRVVRMPTQLGLALYRTQLKGAADLGRVKGIQSEYKVMTLARYLGAPMVNTAHSVWPAITRDSLQGGFWDYANFLLQFSPPLEWEGQLRQRYAEIGLSGAGNEIAPTLSGKKRELLNEAAHSARNTIAAIIPTLTSAEGLFGTPQAMKGRYTQRAVGAMAGLYGNTAEEALYPVYILDQQGRPLDASRNNYVLRFAPGNLPPVDAFWSLTMYDGVTRFLVDNSLDRYLINTSMLPELLRDSDGGITLYLQHAPPEKELRSNWLPAPDGPMSLVLRLYLPKEPALNGQWMPPAIQTGSEIQ